MADAKPIERIYLVVHPGYTIWDDTPALRQKRRELYAGYERVVKKAAKAGHLVIFVEEDLSRRPHAKAFKPPITRRALKEGRFLHVQNSVQAVTTPLLKPAVQAFLDAHRLAPTVTVIGVGEWLDSCTLGEVKFLGRVLRDQMPGTRKVRLMVDSRHGAFYSLHPKAGTTEIKVRYKKILRATAGKRRPWYKRALKAIVRPLKRLRRR